MRHIADILILNQHSSLAFVCPITNTNKNHPFHIELDQRTQTTGIILFDQAEILDVKARNAQFKEEYPIDMRYGMKQKSW